MLLIVKLLQSNSSKQSRNFLDPLGDILMQTFSFSKAFQDAEMDDSSHTGFQTLMEPIMFLEPMADSGYCSRY